MDTLFNRERDVCITHGLVVNTNSTEYNHHTHAKLSRYYASGQKGDPFKPGDPGHMSKVVSLL